MLKTCLEAEAPGYDSAFGFAHFFPTITDPTGECLKGWTLLSPLIAQTMNLKVGLPVTGNIYRNPALPAKMATTVDHLSNGRLILRTDAQRFGLDYNTFDVPYHTPGKRLRGLGGRRADQDAVYPGNDKLQREILHEYRCIL